MKKRVFQLLLGGLLFLPLQEIFAQSKPYKLGKKNQFENSLSNAGRRSGGKADIGLKINDKNELTAEEGIVKKEGRASVYLGKIKNHPNSSYSIKIEDDEVSGEIVLIDQKKAYKYATDPSGDVTIEEVNIHDILCIEYNPEFGEESQQSTSSTQNQGEMQMANSQSVMTLQSLPGAIGVVYLDVDGEVVSGTRWNGGATIVAAHPNLSDAAIREAWELVAEDFRPFNINVTTDRSVFDRAPKNRRMMNIITPTNVVAPGAGGVAYVGSFAWNDDTPCWSFITRGGKSIGEVSSHEIGHTLGLRHDGRTSPQEEYFSGHGNWAPIMGVGYYRNIVQWSRGEYANANNTQDDLGIMASSTYGVGFRSDDHGNTNSAATPLHIAANGSVSTSFNNGVIERRTDTDVFSFSTTGGNVNLNFNPVSRHANLDILVRVFNQNNSQVAELNPSGLSATWNANVPAGTYYLHVSGTGSGDPRTNGYSDYGSLGQYFISGNIAGAGTPNQPPVVSITSPANNASFTAPAAITISANASDPDGSVTLVEFFNGNTKIGERTSVPYTITWSGVNAGSYSLTARATDNQGASTTSTPVNVSVTQPICEIPSNLIATNITETSVTLQWTQAQGAQSFLLWYRRVGDAWSQNQSMIVENNQVNLTNLQPNTEYEYTMRSHCANNQTSAYASPFARFRTLEPNLPPVVSITSPANNASFSAPASIVISASASDPDGSVTLVEFFNGNTKIGERTSSPWEIAWSNVAEGTYTLTAVATDNRGASTTSSPVSVSVLEPVCEIPTSLATSNISEISATLSWAEAEGAQNYLLWYRRVGDAWSQNNSMVVTSNFVTINNLIANTEYEFTLRSQCGNNHNSNYTSPFVRFRTLAPNQPPVVSITSPENNVNFLAPASISISANASDPDGSVTKVEFFEGNNKIGERTSSPWGITWVGVEAGNYALTAVATDNRGATTTSASVHVSVNHSPCAVAPTNVVPTSVSTTAATIMWDNMPGAASYLVWVRQVGGSWVSGTVQRNSVNISGMRANTEYEFAVRTNCANSSSAYTFIYFTTSSTNAALLATASPLNETNTQETIDLSSSQDRHISNYPNPFREETQISFFLNEADKVTLTVVDVAGKIVIPSRTYNLDQGPQTIHINLENEKAGVFLAQITINGKTTILRMVKL
jgi:hypothetical protein